MLDAEDSTPNGGTYSDLSDGTVENASSIETSEVDALQAEVDTLQDQLLRVAADYQNYRRRVEEQRSAESAYLRVSVIQPLLGILDDMERMVAATENPVGERGAGDESATPPTESALAVLREGVALVHRKFVDELEGMGVEVIPSVGHPFDEKFHDALMEQPTADVAPGTVIREVQKGYRLGDRIIRHARVIVGAAAE